LEDTDPEKLAKFTRSGARFYVETISPPKSPSLERWLTTNAMLLATTPFGGRVFALQASPASGSLP
jgi:hypothetical protein